MGADLYLADGFRVRRVDGDGVIATVAGTGVEGHSGDGGPAVAAEIGLPLDVEVGADGVLVTVGDEAVVDEALAPIPGLLTGVVRDSGGTPLPGAWVQVFDGTGYVASKVTGPNGGYFLNGLPPGDYLVRAVHPDSGATWHPGTTYGGSTPVTISTGTTYAHITFP